MGHIVGAVDEFMSTARLFAPIAAWQIAQYLEANDRSAYSGKHRPAYERLPAVVQERRVNAVVTGPNHRLGPRQAGFGGVELGSSGWPSTRSIDVGAVVDPKHAHHACVVVDLMDQAVRTATGGPETCELSLEWVSDPARGIDEGAEHELDHRGGDSFRETCQGTFSPSGNGEPVFRRSHWCRYLARSSSADSTRPFATSSRAILISFIA